VITIGNQPDGININDGVGSTSLGALQKAVVSHGADFGIAFDGDGDRVQMVDHTGVILDGDDLLYIIATDLQERERLPEGSGVVGTLMSNYGLELALKERGIPFARANVGDRYVMQQMQERNWVIGGEGSGHILCAQHHTTGDGIIAALQVLLALQRRGSSMAKERLAWKKLPQRLINVRLPDTNTDPLQHPHVQQLSDQITAELDGRGRVLLRKSGTEPLVRVMVEGQDEAEVLQHARRLADQVEKVCS
jgi:phosphoglucosamine mutase